jgi:hypothetical protein
VTLKQLLPELSWRQVGAAVLEAERVWCDAQRDDLLALLYNQSFKVFATPLATLDINAREALVLGQRSLVLHAARVAAAQSRVDALAGDAHPAS